MSEKAKGEILLTGGAGYIGSHVYYALRDQGWTPLVIDNFSTGRRDLLPRDAVIYEGDIGDRAILQEIFDTHAIQAVMHFAALTDVPDSMKNPLLYYQNNVAQSFVLLDEMEKANIKSLIFSSSASVYGIPESLPVTEEMTPAPISPYGHSKQIMEDTLRHSEGGTGLKSICLRYFNVAGADPEGRTGPTGNGPIHLIRAAAQVYLGARDELTIFGTDYDTRDGTCIRDFIHIHDLADMHVRALAHLLEKRESLILNCGYGTGTTIREVAQALKNLAHPRKISVTEAPRRAGDIPESYADTQKLSSLFPDWQPSLASIEDLIASEAAGLARLKDKAA